MKREDFLKKVCPTVAFAFFGLSFLESCSSSSEDDSIENDTPDSSAGYSVNGNIITIDINHPTFSNLKSIGGWTNNLAINVILLRTNDTTVLAFSNACPHNGTRSSWNLDENTNRFVCNQHTNISLDTRSFSTECPTNNSQIECYTTAPLDGSTLVVTKN